MKLIDRALLLLAAHTTSGEDMTEEAQSTVQAPQSGASILGDLEHAAQLAVSDVTKFVEHPLTQLNQVVTVTQSIIAALTHLGTAHNALSAIEGGLASEVATIKAIVEEQIVAFTKKIAA